MFKNKMHKKISELKTEKLKRKVKKRLNEERHKLHTSPDIITLLQITLAETSGVTWYTSGNENTFSAVRKKPRRTKLLARQKRKEEIIIKIGNK